MASRLRELAKLKQEGIIREEEFALKKQQLLGILPRRSTAGQQNTMNNSDYRKRQDDLFARWKRARPEYETNGRRFANDGIVDVTKWNVAKPKTMFLLKETYADPEEWEPCWGITSNANTFSLNIARWHSILRTLFKEPSAVLSFADIRFPETVTDIALVEVKKVNDGSPTSNLKEILQYAARDRDFLQEQIELIQPEVIFCCYTIDAYEAIYPDPNDPWEEEICRVPATWNPAKCVSCAKHRGRLVIDFYHPSTRGQHDEELFAMLCDMIRNGKVFDHFAWSKTG